MQIVCGGIAVAVTGAAVAGVAGAAVVGVVGAVVVSVAGIAVVGVVGGVVVDVAGVAAVGVAGAAVVGVIGAVVVAVAGAARLCMLCILRMLCMLCILRMPCMLGKFRMLRLDTKIQLPKSRINENSASQIEPQRQNRRKPSLEGRCQYLLLGLERKWNFRASESMKNQPPSSSPSPRSTQNLAPRNAVSTHC